MPFPPLKGRRRRCVLCGLPELAPVADRGRFLFVPDPEGRGPICPSESGCGDRARQLSLLPAERKVS